MADNVGYTPGIGAEVAADNIGGVLHQRIKIGIGAGGTAVDLSSTNPMPITASSAIPISTPSAIDVTVGNFPATQTVNVLDPSTETAFGPVTAASTVLFSAVDTANERTIILQLSGLWEGGFYLQASQDNTTWWACQGFGSSSNVVLSDTFYNPDIITVPVVARYFRAITTPDFSGSISGSYSLRAIDTPPFWNNSQLVAVDPSVTMPVGGVDPNGHVLRMALAPSGGVFPADGTTVTGSRQGASVGPVVLVDTAGYGSIVLQLAGTFTGTISFQASNDRTTWTSVAGWSVSGAATPVTTATAVGQWVFPAAGRYFRAQITTAGTGVPLGIVVLRNFSAWAPQSTPAVTATNLSTNIAQIGGTSPVTAGVAGMFAVGGNIAEDTAATSNPLICGGVARTALPASTLASGDAIRQTFSVSGQLITKLNASGDLDFYVNATVTTNTQTALRAAQTSPIRQNVTKLTFQNTNATATTLTIQDGSTTLITFSVPASMTLPVQLDFPTPLRGTAATALNYIAGTTGANILLNVTGFNSY